MPELPEVESVRLDLLRIVGWEITRAWADSALKYQSAAGAIGRITGVLRRGKHLGIELEHGVLAIHLGMTGQVLIDPPEVSHVRAEFILRDSYGEEHRLVFRDPRRFGKACLVESFDAVVAKLGPEPFSPEALPSLVAALSKTSRPVKAVLLDQTVIAGVGNIYADEALFAAKIRPSTKGSSLSKSRTRALAAAVAAAIERGLANGGTTLRDYRRADGSEGEHQHQLQVYGRSGEPCVVCGTPLVATTVAQRTSTYCSHCQRA